jgi:hypothetical protein
LCVDLQWKSIPLEVIIALLGNIFNRSIAAQSVPYSSVILCRNGLARFDQAAGREMRSATAGEIRVPLRGHKTLLNTAAIIWNGSPDLRAAKTLLLAKRAANVFASNIPI